MGLIRYSLRISKMRRNVKYSFLAIGTVVIVIGMMVFSSDIRFTQCDCTPLRQPRNTPQLRDTLSNSSSTNNSSTNSSTTPGWKMWDNSLWEVRVRDSGSSPEAIQEDMERCSLAMGMSPAALRSARDTLRQMSEKASHLLSAIQSIVPKTFSNEYKNPCWHLPVKGQESLLCLPYFFLVGSTKSGMTVLHAILSNHSEIVRPTWKESQWWTRGMQEYHTDIIMKYLMNFKNAITEIAHNHSRITYDSSQSTIYDSSFFVDHRDYCVTPAIVSRVLPDAKIILLMRDPVPQLYSHYLFTCERDKGQDMRDWPDNIRQNPAVYFHQEAMSAIQYFNNCLENCSLIECTNENRFRADKCGDVGLQLTIGIYYIHFLKWLQFYPRERFLFLKIEDLSESPHAFATQITDFLGVQRISEEEAKRWSSSHQLTGVPSGAKLQMRNETRKLLEKFYRPYNAKLSELTNVRARLDLDMV